MSVTFTLNDAEAAILNQILHSAEDELSNSSCNDLLVPNTPENWALYCEIMEYEIGEGFTVEDERPGSKKIIFHDQLALAYFRKKIFGLDIEKPVMTTPVTQVIQQPLPPPSVEYQSFNKPITDEDLF